MPGRTSHRSRPSRRVPSAQPPRRRLRIGFIDLLDAAPLIAAVELGFFADEHLDVLLERQLGWGSIRDKLTFGQLDAAHALVGMPLFSHLSRDWFLEPLVAVMNLGAGGNAITFSKRLADAGVRSATTLSDYIRNDPRHEVMLFAHVFSCSMHHFLLRDWLAAEGIEPERDIRLRVFPPNQLAGHMARGDVDGFCVGEPWNTLAEQSGAGQIAAATVDILPDHPEKVLAVTRSWKRANEGLLEPMIRALLRGCAYCHDPANRLALATMLSLPHYLNVPTELLLKSISLDPAASGRLTTSTPWSTAPATTFPSKTHSAWIASQMIRWGQLPPQTDILAVANESADPAAYRAVAGSLGIPCPDDDFAPMKLRRGFFDPKTELPIEPLLEGALS